MAIKVFFALFSVTIPFLSIAQFGGNYRNYLEEIKGHDMSIVFLQDSIIIPEQYISTNRKPILGFFGDNYQRINVRFISIVKNQSNPLQYFVYGKTRLKENISEFQGTITINNSEIDAVSIPRYKRGYFLATYEFYEDAKKSKTGYFSGKCKSDFYFDSENKVKYDALDIGADGFKNNQFEGTWTGYTSKKQYTCNWGDYRIPKLTGGAGYLTIGQEYWSRGWESYMISLGSRHTKEEVEIAKKKEYEKWWE